MSSLSPSLVVIGPSSPRWEGLGVTQFSDLRSALLQINFDQCQALVTSVATVQTKKFQDFWGSRSQSYPPMQLILIGPADYRSKDFVLLYESLGSIFRWRSSFEDPHLEQDLTEALQTSRKHTQNMTLQFLLQQQNSELRDLKKELQMKIHKRSKYLMEARRKLFVTQTRLELLHKILLEFQTSNPQSTEALEVILNQSLNAALDTQWIRVLLKPQDQLFLSEIQRNLNYKILRRPVYEGEIQIGSLFFMRSSPHEFKKDESEFFGQIAEAVSVAWSRVHRTQELESVHTQWNQTFQAIQNPVLLIDSQYHVLQSNRAQPGRCYEKLFGRTKPCDGCQLGSEFMIHDEKEIYQVQSQKIDNHFINIYYSKTQELRWEARVLEMSRTTELGTIGSSMAHELNNPLAGLLTFIELIKSEPDTKDEFKKELEEMEKIGFKARDIIQNLLIFSRSPDLQSQDLFDLNTLTEQALKISEITAKNRGYHLHFAKTLTPLMIQGNANLMALALRNVIQAGLDLLPVPHQEMIPIHIQESAEKISWELEIARPSENALLTKSNLSWILAEQILLDQRADLAFEVNPHKKISIRITFSRPVLTMHPR